MNIDGKSSATEQKSRPVEAVHPIEAICQMMEKNLPEGSVRTATPLFRDESGEVVLSHISWKIPGGNEASGD